jgi:superfamily I DNA/RNA helicase
MPDPLIADAEARATAIDIARSVIVQAPAGSGKTDLLTRRFLRLLAAVDEPEDILAITFTRAATAEMRSRIITDLETVARHSVFPPGDLDRLALAKAALAQSERRGWNLLDHPERLAIETIDSLCLRIAHDRPSAAASSPPNTPPRSTPSPPAALSSISVAPTQSSTPPSLTSSTSATINSPAANRSSPKCSPNAISGSTSSRSPAK